MSESARNEADAVSPPGRFSLHNLSAAFARLTGVSEAEPSNAEVADALQQLPELSNSAGGESLSPRMIVEGMLFVGNGEGRPLTSREIAAHIRDVSPREVETLIDQLNDLYAKTHSAYRIVGEGKGFRFALEPRLDPVRQRFHGRVREAKLTPTAIEVLSVVAYRQPIHAEEVTKLRGVRSHAILCQLVRRGLLRLDRPENSPRRPVYQTTERFNTLFRIGSPQDLPNSEDLDDC